MFSRSIQLPNCHILVREIDVRIAFTFWKTHFPCHPDTFPIQPEGLVDIEQFSVQPAERIRQTGRPVSLTIDLGKSHAFAQILRFGHSAKVTEPKSANKE